jgi:hypothetical protein
MQKTTILINSDKKTIRTYPIKVWLYNKGIDKQFEMCGCENVLLISGKNLATAAWQQSIQKNA